MNKKTIPLLELAKAQHRCGDIKKAIKTYQKILKEHSSTSEIMNALTVAYAQLGYYGDAFEQIKKAIKQNNSNATLYNTLGNLHFRLKEWSAAKKAYQKACQLSPKFISPCNNLANVYAKTGELNKAEESYKHAIKMNEDFPDAHYNYATLLAQTDRIDEAIFELEETLRTMPKHAKAYAQLGQLQLGKNNFKKAVMYFKKSLNIRQDYANVHFGLGQAQLKMNQFKEAIDSFLNTIEKEKNHFLAHYFLATTYLKIDDKENALKHYLQQLHINPTPETYYNTGVLLMNQARYKESLDYFKHAIKMHPKYLSAYLNLGATYLKLHQVQKASDSYKKALTLDPSNDEIYYVVSALDNTESGKKPLKAPKDYLVHLFDQYASYYDKHLMQHLDYRLPQLLFDCLLKNTFLTDEKWTIIDLGCGTGLCGQVVKSYAKTLIGVDISPKMLSIAKEKNIYDELRCLDIIDALSLYHDFFDLIIAGDVLTYIGDLSTIFQKTAISLRANGFLIFSIEKSLQAPYTLQKNMRYAHQHSYIQKLTLQNGFVVIQSDSIVLRTQEKKPVNGFLFLLQKIK